MRKVKLTQGYVALVDDEDYQRVAQFKWCVHKVLNKDGSIKTLYAHRGYKLADRWTTQKLHRFIRRVSNPKVKVDHENRNGLDCRKNNLRKASNAQNASNTKLYSTSTSGTKGVHWNKQNKSWVAYIYCNNKRIHLGYFTDKKEAAKARLKAAVKFHGKFRS